MKKLGVETLSKSEVDPDVPVGGKGGYGAIIMYSVLWTRRQFWTTCVTVSKCLQYRKMIKKHLGTNQIKNKQLDVDSYLLS